MQKTAQIHRQLVPKISDELLDLVPRPTNAERRTLKFSIMSDGQKLPIILNRWGYILDGHTRYEICQELHLKPKFKIKNFRTKEEERKFVILSNIARRNLTKFQKIECAWEIYENEKRRAWKRENWRKFGKLPPPKEGNAMEIFAKYMETGHTVIHQIEWLKKNADEAILQKLRTDEISISRAYHKLKGIVFLKALRKHRIKPKKPEDCPECHYDVVTSRKRKCHVHKWYCCSTCKWGLS